MISLQPTFAGQSDDQD